MSNYLLPIKMALIFFPFVAMLMTIPFAIYNYRKYGYVNKLRVVLTFSFIFYLISAYYLVILPLPKTRDVKSIQSADVEYYNLKPLRFIEDIERESKVDFSNPKDYVNLFKERAVLQVIFNIILTLPLGIYLRYYFNQSLLKTLIISFCLSLFFELTQLSGLYGLYNAPYRIFDVDDLLCNTLGGVLGYVFSPVFTFFLPESKELDKNVDLSKIRVGFLRRFISFSVDIIFLNFISSKVDYLSLKIILVFLYTIMLPYGTGGKTLGSLVTASRIDGEHGRLSFWQIFTRQGILFLALPAINLFFQNIINMNQNTDYYMVAASFSMFYLLFVVVLLGHFAYCLFKRERFFYEKISRTRIVVASEKFKGGNSMEIRLASKNDMEAIMDIVRAAQAYFKMEKIPQWQNGYPNEESIEKDMARDSFYVLEDGGKILGVMAGIIGREVTYDKIYEGSWLTSGDSYITLHRVAVDPEEKGRGLGYKLFEKAEELARKNKLSSMRIDTHRENRSMNRLIEKYGFKYCGIVYMEDGGERLAYEKVLEY